MVSKGLTTYHRCMVHNVHVHACTLLYCAPAGVRGWIENALWRRCGWLMHYIQGVHCMIWLVGTTFPCSIASRVYTVWCHIKGVLYWMMIWLVGTTIPCSIASRAYTVWCHIKGVLYWMMIWLVGTTIPCSIASRVYTVWCHIKGVLYWMMIWLVGTTIPCSMVSLVRPQRIWQHSTMWLNHLKLPWYAQYKGWLHATRYLRLPW